MSIFKLPNELILHIFTYLDNAEVDRLICNYRGVPSARPVLCILYQRLFGGALHITNEDPRLQFEHDYEVTVSAFEDKMSDDSFENNLFRLTRPNTIEFRFTRQHNDYRRFISDLNSLTALFDSSDATITNYLRRCSRINLHIDAHLVFMENPDSLKSIIIKLLLDLSGHPIAYKLENLTIKSSEIGSLYVAHWSQLFKNFTSLRNLDISENLLRSNYESYLDVWGMSRKFPETLTRLNLKNNMLTYVSKDFLSNLPKSLQFLDMNQNDIEIIEPCQLGELLPGLQNWCLNYTKLCVMSPSMFKSCPRGFVLEIRSTYLPDSDVQKLTLIAEKGGFKVLV